MSIELNREDVTIILLTKRIMSNYKACLNKLLKKIEHYWLEINTKEKLFALALFLSDYVF